MQYNALNNNQKQTITVHLEKKIINRLLELPLSPLKLSSQASSFQQRQFYKTIKPV